MIDGHVHLDSGELTKEYVYEFIKFAIDRNIDEIQFVNHTHHFQEFRPLYVKYKNVPEQNEWLTKDCKYSINDYIKLIEEMKKESLPIKLKFGLEVCYSHEDNDLIKELVGCYNWDFLIGSVHGINYFMYDSGWSKKRLWEVYDTDQIYKDYYKEVIALVESDIFTQLGHPDTIKMFNYYPSYDLVPTYNKLAELAKDHNIKVENNLGCYYRYHHQDKGLNTALLKIFKDHKCQMITVSDAHKPQDIGSYIKDVWDITMN